MTWTESDIGIVTAQEAGIRYVLIPGGGVFDLAHTKGVAEHLARQKAHGLAAWISGEVRMSYRPESAKVGPLKRTKGGFQGQGKRAKA